MDLYQQIIFTTLAVAFGFLHFILYLYNRKSKSNLYFSLFAIMYALNVFFDFQSGLSEGPGVGFFYLQIHRAVLPYTPIFLALFVYSLFATRIPKHFWIIAGGLVITSFFAAIEPIENFKYFQFFLFAMLIEALRLVVKGFKQKSDGSWIIPLGFLLLIIGSSYDMLIDLGVMEAINDIHNGYPYGYLGLFISMSVYLARNLATTNTQLEEISTQQKSTITQLKNEITERQRAERINRQQQEKLIQADKMASVGILVSGVAHEINNPNNYMMLNSNNLADVWNELKPVLEKYAQDQGDFTVAGLPYSDLKEEVGGLISGISEGSKRIRTIVDSLKDFARKDPGRMDEIVNVNSVIKSSTVILANLIKNSSDYFKTELSEELPKIKGNQQQIEQVIINLLSNSCQALENRSKAITIGTAFDEVNKSVTIKVADEGKGINTDDLKNIMDPFFTTKRDSGGTGLGLSISYNIIKDHNGKIDVESELGKGTVITITLPTG